MSDVGRTRTRIEQESQSRRGVNFLWPLPESRTLVLCIDEMADIDGRSFEALTREAFAAFQSPDYERLVIDLRRNGGGDNQLGEPLRRVIAASRFNRSGGIYVLISPKTFSAAQNLATRSERETLALFVGTPSGGAPNHFGDAKPFVGSVTGLTSIVSTLPWFDSVPQDKRKWIMPDLVVPDLYADWQSGRDPALERALSHRTDRPVDEFSSDQFFPYSRSTQKADWRPFWADQSRPD